MFLKLWLSKKIAMIELIRRKRCCQEIVRTKASDPLFEQRLNSNDKYCFPVDYALVGVNSFFRHLTNDALHNNF